MRPRDGGTGEPRRRLILIGLSVLAATAIALVIAVMIGTITPTRGEPSPVAAQDLRAGMCVEEFEFGLAEYRVVDCATPHPAELVYRPQVVPGLVSAEARYPGDLAVSSYVEVACRQATIGGLHFDRDAFPDDAEQRYQFELPTELAWARGDTGGWCWIVAADGDLYTRGYSLLH